MNKPPPRPSCPVPHAAGPRVQLGHGGGGRLMHELLSRTVLPGLGDAALSEMDDSARLDLDGAPVAFTTDSFVVRPLFFPGGDIGTLAVNGTVNDLAMARARPVALTCSLILEEGLEIAVLERVMASMKQAADAVGVRIVTGDTKVVERGRGDGVYINTAGIGLVTHPAPSGLRQVEVGDVILLNGDIGRHGATLLAAREDLGLDAQLFTDCAPLWPTVDALLSAGVQPRVMRDVTRGGLAATLVELSQGAGRGFSIEAQAVVVGEGVRGVSELCGFDPWHLPCEGRFVAVVAADDRDTALDVLRRFDNQAAPVGEVVAGPARVTRRSALGVDRVVDLPAGELLPRIC